MTEAALLNRSDGSRVPIASTSRLLLDDDDHDAGLPTLAQLLEETVRASSGGSSRRHHHGEDEATPSPSLPSLPVLSSIASRSYVSSLLSKDLPALLKEPDELAKQAEMLDGDLASLCYRSTSDLLGVGECMDGVEDGFGCVGRKDFRGLGLILSRCILPKTNARCSRLAADLYRRIIVILLDFQDLLQSDTHLAITL